MNYTSLVPKPTPDSINSGLHPLSVKELERHLGKPRSTYTDECQPITNKVILKRIKNIDVGPFYVTGMDIALEDLILIFADVKEHEPKLYKLLGTAGMLCARLVRGSKSTLSNHSYGLAIDIKISGKLDVTGDNKVQRGLLILYKFFNKHGWYWGAEYPTEDGMHFEMSLERLHKKLGVK